MNSWQSASAKIRFNRLQYCEFEICFVSSSQLLHLFNQLKTEILQSHMMEKTFILIQELLTAAEKSFNLKKYFWKVLLIFLFSVPVLWECLLIQYYSSLFSPQISSCLWWVNFSDICPILPVVHPGRKEATEKMSWSKFD